MQIPLVAVDSCECDQLNAASNGYQASYNNKPGNSNFHFPRIVAVNNCLFRPIWGRTSPNLRRFATDWSLLWQLFCSYCSSHLPTKLGRNYVIATQSPSPTAFVTTPNGRNHTLQTEHNTSHPRV